MLHYKLHLDLLFLLYHSYIFTKILNAWLCDHKFETGNITNIPKKICRC